MNAVAIRGQHRNGSQREVALPAKRRGANMGVLRVDHPDIRAFIRAKLDGSLRNFNLSVAVTDAFMEAALRGDDYPLVDPRGGAHAGRADAAGIFRSIVESAWRTGDRRAHVLEEEVLVETNRSLLDLAAGYGMDAGELDRIVQRHGRLGDARGVPEELKRLSITAYEVPPDRHLEIQAAFQRQVDNSVSKTVNLREEASVDDVARIYARAWELGLKGITIFRYGSKGVQVLEPGIGTQRAASD